MFKTLRTLTAAAAVVAAIPQLAQAAPVTLDFEGTSTGYLSTELNSAPYGNVTFPGGMGYSFAATLGNGSTTQALQGRCPVASPGCQTPLEIAVGAGFEGSLDFDVAAMGNLLVQLFDSSNTLLSQVQLSNLGGWSQATLAFAGTATRMVFIGDEQSYALDNIHYDTKAPTNGGGEVPEPASVALVALALAGAAAAGRRRRRG